MAMKFSAKILWIKLRYSNIHFVLFYLLQSSMLSSYEEESLKWFLETRILRKHIQISIGSHVHNKKNL